MPKPGKQTSIGQPLAFSVAEFCRAHSISPRTYYRLRAEGRGPAEIRIGHCILISQEAAARWRAWMEAERKETD